MNQALDAALTEISGLDQALDASKTEVSGLNQALDASKTEVMELKQARDAAQTKIGDLSDKLKEVSNNFDLLTKSNILLGSNTLISAHYYVFDVTELVKANMQGGQLVFPAGGRKDKPLDSLFGDPHPLIEKALVVTWIDKNLRIQKRAFKQLDLEREYAESQFRGCKLWYE